MSRAAERLLRAYRPMYQRSAMVEGAWLHRPPAPHESTPPRRLSLLAWLALVLPRRGRGVP